MYKLIAIDLDGTLLNSYGQISEKNKLALNNAKENFNRDKQNNDINNDSNMKDYIFNNIDKLQKDELAILKAKIMKMQEEKSE